MPWKGEKDPYKIWLSEVILQQTRVEQGLNYYQRFITKYPTVQDLAKGDEQTVYKLWEGLGYYNRCRNLLETARYISKERDGKFPSAYEDLIRLKGVGSYTASAIASFAYNLPNAVVDGNVYRVLSRIFGIRKSISTAKGKVYFNLLANELIDKKKPAAYNQAIMDFGAVVCRPVNPECDICIFSKNCFAFRKGVTDKLPVKAKKNKIKKRWFYYLLPEKGENIFIQKRNPGDIWENLYEFLLTEFDKEVPEKKLDTLIQKNRSLQNNRVVITGYSKVYHQQLSHQKISARFIRCKGLKRTAHKKLISTNRKSLNNYPFPRIIREYLFDERLIH